METWQLGAWGPRRASWPWQWAPLLTAFEAATGSPGHHEGTWVPHAHGLFWVSSMAPGPPFIPFMPLAPRHRPVWGAGAPLTPWWAERCCGRFAASMPPAARPGRPSAHCGPWARLAGEEAGPEGADYPEGRRGSGQSLSAWTGGGGSPGGTAWPGSSGHSLSSPLH